MSQHMHMQVFLVSLQKIHVHVLQFCVGSDRLET
jgi:hypothetical protein